MIRLAPLLVPLVVLLSHPTDGYGTNVLVAKAGTPVITKTLTSGPYTAKFSLLEGDRATKKIKSISVGKLEIRCAEEGCTLTHPKVRLHFENGVLSNWRWINGRIAGRFLSVDCVPRGYLDVDHEDLPNIWSHSKEACEKHPLCHKDSEYGSVQTHAKSSLLNPIQLNTENEDTVGVFEYFASGTGIGRGHTKTHLFNLSTGEYFVIKDSCAEVPELFYNDDGTLAHHVTYSPPPDKGAQGTYWSYLCTRPDRHTSLNVWMPIARTLQGAVNIDATRQMFERDKDIHPLLSLKLSNNDLIKIAKYLGRYKAGPYEYCIPNHSSPISDMEKDEILPLLDRFFIHYTYDLLTPDKTFAHQIEMVSSPQARRTLGWLQRLTSGLLGDWGAAITVN